nr:unnamed protein product [Callosobruchus analis]
MLERTVNVVFHSAATVKFDEKLKLSVTINLVGTRRLVELCKRMDHLEALVHVSTAYCNCDRKEVTEVVYPPPMDPERVTTLVDCLEEPLVDQLTAGLVGNRPNTYTFTKALAECWLRDHSDGLPLAIVRPSIVLSSAGGPMRGWVDNWNGPTDLVPVDMVINLMIVSAWRVGTTKPKELQIYNCVTGKENIIICYNLYHVQCSEYHHNLNLSQRKPITWQQFIDLCFKYMRKHPFSDVCWYPNGSVSGSRTLNTFNWIFLHWIPAHIIDSFVWLTEYFTTQEWQFNDENVRNLVSTLSEVDKEVFCFDVAKIDWDKYIEDYVLGIRR